MIKGKDSMDDVTARAIRTWSNVFPGEDLTAYEVMLRLIRGGRIAESAMHPAAADTEGLEVPGDYEVLASLRRAHPEPLRPVTIARRVMISPPGLTGRLDRLEQAGLIERAAHPRDRRAVLIHLTEQGLAVVDETFASVLAEMRHLAASIAPDEMRRTANCLQTILIALGDVPVSSEAPA